MTARIRPTLDGTITPLDSAPDENAPPTDAARSRRILSDFDQRAWLAKIARLYYVEGFSQPQIADRLKMSVAGVSRAIAKARRLEVVRITIDETLDRAGQLETEMERAWGLRECLLVPSDPRLEAMYVEMARVVSRVLGRLLAEGAALGVSWGETLKTIGDNLTPATIDGLRVVPIIGAMGRVNTGIYPNAIARAFAERLGGTPYLVNTPAVVDNPSVRDSLVLESGFRWVSELWGQLSAAILSVSGLDEDTSAYRGGVFSSAELAELRSSGGVCATNFVILDESGKTLQNPISDRIINLPFDQLTRIDEVVLVAAGERKITPLRSALKAGIVTRLITDVDVATELLAAEPPKDRRSRR